jgi:hypothetical protein
LKKVSYGYYIFVGMVILALHRKTGLQWPASASLPLQLLFVIYFLWDNSIIWGLGFEGGEAEAGSGHSYLMIFS